MAGLSDFNVVLGGGAHLGGDGFEQRRVPITQFERFVTSVVVVTTLISPLTVSPLLWLLAG